MLTTIFLTIIAMFSCNKEDIKVNEVPTKQHDLINIPFNISNFNSFHFDAYVEDEDVKIVKPEEEPFLTGRINLKDLIPLIPTATKYFGCGVVLAMRDNRDDYVSFIIIGNLMGTDIRPAWYDRLHGHILTHYNDSSFVTTIDAIDPDNPPVNCIRTLDINIAFSFIISSFSAKKDVYIEHMSDGWYLFNGYCKKNE